MFRLLCLLPAFLVGAGLFAQGPLDGYLKGKGKLDIVPSLSFNSAQRFVGAGGQVYDAAFRGSTLSLFAEYGLTERFDLVGTAAYVFTNNQSGLQDGGFFVKYRPFFRTFSPNNRLGILLGAGAAFPLSDYEPTANGALGQKAVTAPARLIVQWETPAGLFLNLTGGYNARFDRLQEADIARVRQERPDYQPIDPASFYTVLFKIGLPAARYYLDAWVEWQHTPGGADFVPDMVDLPQAYGVSYTQIGGTLYYTENGKNGIALSGAYILGGRNTSRMMRITVGYVF